MNIEQIKRLLFNGKTLDNKFRRGLWSVVDFNKLTTEQTTEQQKKQITDLLNEQTTGFLYYNGGVVLLTSKNNYIINEHANDNVKAVVDYLQTINKKSVVFDNRLDNGSRVGCGKSSNNNYILDL